MGNKFRNSPRAYIVRLELADRPGELLRVLEPSSTKDEVIWQETLLKKKLGSRAFGLNAN